MVCCGEVGERDVVGIEISTVGAISLGGMKSTGEEVGDAVEVGDGKLTHDAMGPIGFSGWSCQALTLFGCLQQTISSDGNDDDSQNSRHWGILILINDVSNTLTHLHTYIDQISLASSRSRCPKNSPATVRIISSMARVC